MAQYTKEIRLITDKGEFLKTITGNYEVIFDKIMRVDNANRPTQIIAYSDNQASDTMVFPKAILVCFASTGIPISIPPFLILNTNSV